MQLMLMLLNLTIRRFVLKQIWDQVLQCFTGEKQILPFGQNCTRFANAFANVSGYALCKRLGSLLNFSYLLISGAQKSTNNVKCQPLVASRLLLAKRDVGETTQDIGETTRDVRELTRWRNNHRWTLINNCLTQLYNTVKSILTFLCYFW